MSDSWLYYDLYVLCAIFEDFGLSPSFAGSKVLTLSFFPD